MEVRNKFNIARRRTHKHRNDINSYHVPILILIAYRHTVRRFSAKFIVKETKQMTG